MIFFNPVFVVGRNLDETWFKLLVGLCKSGRFIKVDEGSFQDDFRLEFDYASGVIQEAVQYSDSGQMLNMAPTVPDGCPPPTTDEKIHNYYKNYLLNSTLASNEHYRYSTWIVGGKYELPQVSFPGKITIKSKERFPIIVPNQLEWGIEHYAKSFLKKGADGGFGNNHVALQIGYPESNLAYDTRYSTELGRGTSPCLRILDTKIIKGHDGEWYLCFSVYFRSWDLWGGFPENMGGLAHLMHYMATALTVRTSTTIRPGYLAFSAAKLHVYGHSMQILAMRTGNSDIRELFEKAKKLRESGDI